MSNSKQADRNLSSLAPTAQKACRLFLDTCQKNKLPIFITETYRSQERQDYLYAQGRTRPGNKVTWAKKSRHTLRYAWDIACSPPYALYDTELIKKAGQVAQSLGIEWGGTWKEQDTCHFEVKETWQMPTFTYNHAVQILAERGILQSPEAWLVPNTKYIGVLIEKLGGIDTLAREGIFTEKHTEQLIIALGKYYA